MKGLILLLHLIIVLSHCGTKIRVKCSGSCLKQDKVTFSQQTIVNIYIVYVISKNYNVSSYPTLENCFLTLELTLELLL